MSARGTCWSAGYIGIPFAGHGRDRAGCDCWGLVRLVLAEQAGLDLPDHGTDYGTVSDGAGVARAVAGGVAGGLWTEIPEGDEAPLDAVLMKGYVRGPDGLKAHDMHTGVVVRPGVLLHVERGIDASLGAYRQDARLRSRVRGFFRHRALVEAAR